MTKIADFAQVSRVDHKGRTFANFYPAKNKTGPGYVVMGRTDEGAYGGALVTVCARLVRVRKDGRQIFTGWRREWDAYQFSLYMLGTDAGTIR